MPITDDEIARIAKAAAAEVWARAVSRNSGDVSAIQELADSKTLGLKNAARLDALEAKVDGLNVEAAAKAGAAQAIAEGVKVTGTLTVEPQ